MKYCSRCGGVLAVRVPAGDNRPRHVCSLCDTVHYRNPRIVTGCIAEWERGILLCRRAIQPRRALWTLPAGFMENGESVQAGAVRETLEEANARVVPEALFATFTLTHIDQVYMLFRGPLCDADFAPGEESLEVALFDEATIPWRSLAFPVMHEVLRLYWRDRGAGAFGVYTGELTLDGPDYGRYRVTYL